MIASAPLFTPVRQSPPATFSLSCFVSGGDGASSPPLSPFDNKCYCILAGRCEGGDSLLRSDGPSGLHR